MILFFVPDYKLILNISSRVTNLLPLLSSSLFSGFHRFLQKRSQLVIKCYANVAGDNQIQHPFLIHTYYTQKLLNFAYLIKNNTRARQGARKVLVGIRLMI